MRALRVALPSRDPQGGGLLTADDLASGQALWSLVVHENKRRPDLEADVQDVFFTEMHLAPDGTLLIVNELRDRYRVDVDARTSTLIDRR